jgi:sugar phosphate isomerase/epimerase
VSSLSEQTLKPTRRQWLAGLTAVSAASAVIEYPLSGAANPRSFGVQLYTVRNLLRKEPDRTLQAIAAIGYREVEGYNRPDMLALMTKIKQNGLTPRSCYIETPLITTDWEQYPDLRRVSLPEAIDSVRDAGIGYFTMDYIPPGARGDADDFYRRTADRMNAAAEMCRIAGLKFAYRNHAFEFGGRAGLRPIDIFLERLEPKLVGFEMDAFWASVAGLDPVELIRSWKGRVPMLHLQDKARGTPGQFSENAGPGAFAEAGGGVLNFPAILKAAAAAGVKYYFVEQDQVSGDPLESLRKSFEYLKTL